MKMRRRGQQINVKIPTGVDLIVKKEKSSTNKYIGEKRD